MNTETALTVVQRAVVALGYDAENRKGLTVLAGESKHITTITNQDGREQVHSALMKLKNTRIAIEKRGKAAREDATAFSKAVISEEDALVGIISPEEDRLQELRDEWDDRIEAERQAKIEAEQKRVAEIQQKIAAIRSTVETAFKMNQSAEIGRLMADLAAMPITEALFGELAQVAEQAQLESMSRLADLHAAAKNREAQEERNRLEREELARQRAEQDVKDKAERDRVAAETAAANKKLADERAAFDAEQARTREAQRLENERIAAEQAAAQKVIDDQRRELEARQQAERDAEATRARIEREAAAERERKAQEEQRLNFKPTLDELASVIAAHYDRDFDVARGWIVDTVRSEQKVAA